MTRFFTAMAAALAVVALSAAPAAAGEWLPEVPTGAGAGANQQAIAVNPRGDTLVAWNTPTGIQTAFRPAGAAAFEAVQQPFTGAAGALSLALDPQGNAIVIWNDNTNLDSSVRPAGGNWQPAENISPFSPSSFRVVMDANGSATALYIEGGDVYASDRTIGAGKTLLSATWEDDVTREIVHDEVSNAVVGSLQIAGNASGQIAAVWTQNNTFTYAMAARRTAAGAGFEPAQRLTSAAGPNAANPAVAINASGDAVTVFNQRLGAADSAAWSARDAGSAAWSPADPSAPDYLPGANEVVALGTPRVGIDAMGNAVAAWQTTSTPSQVHAAVRPAGGTFAARQVLSDTTAAATAPVVAAGGGSPLVAWIQVAGIDRRVDSKVWSGGAFGARQTATTTDSGLSSLGVGMDDEGNAAAVWETTIPESTGAAVFDGAGPAFALASFDPLAPNPGGLITFGITGLADRWSTVDSTTWDFGDGATASGTSVQHAYAGAGDFTATVTARDARGNTRVASQGVTVTAAQAPPTAPSPGGTPPLPPPVLAKLVNATPVSGTVRVRLPGSRVFVALAEARQIPMGSIVDARKGRVRITGTDGRTTFTAEFYEGMFRITQGRRRGSPVNIILFGGSFKGCPRAPKAQLSALSKKRSVRHLWGDGKGKFRTVGRFSSATVRGTKWLTDDRCNGTRTRVAKGSVTVRDFVRRKNVVIRAPKSYFAQPARRRR